MCLAVPGKIESIEGEDQIFRMGKIYFGGILKTVNLSCVPDARIGDYVLVHAGFAISVIDEEEARKTLECFDAINGIESIIETPKHRHEIH
jgi:hydrogenase expression/formation protein HypC